MRETFADQAGRAAGYLLLLDFPALKVALLKVLITLSSCQMLADSSYWSQQEAGHVYTLNFHFPKKKILTNSILWELDEVNIPVASNYLK